MNYTVYKHTSPSGKVYIGITSQKVQDRWCRQGQGYKKNTHFYRAIQKYGWDNFKHEILYTGMPEMDAKHKEIELIKKHQSNNPKNGYNLTIGGDGVIGIVRNDVWKKRIGIALKGNKNGNGSKGLKRSEEQKKRMSAITKSTMTDERKLKQSKVMRGRYIGEKHPFYGGCHTKAAKEKCGLSQKGGKSINAKKVLCDGVIYDCITDCAAKYKIHPKNLGRYLNGNRKMPLMFQELGLMYID